MSNLPLPHKQPATIEVTPSDRAKVACALHGLERALARLDAAGAHVGVELPLDEAKTIWARISNAKDFLAQAEANLHARIWGGAK